jgi:hypothetical protein
LESLRKDFSSRKPARFALLAWRAWEAKMQSENYYAENKDIFFFNLAALRLCVRTL